MANLFALFVLTDLVFCLLLLIDFVVAFELLFGCLLWQINI